MPDERHLSTLFWSLPMIDADEAAGRRIAHWKDWISHPSYDEYWEAMSPIGQNYGEVSAAAYNMAGWFDVFLQGSLNNFIGMTTGAKTPEARRNQKLLVGPWIHQLGDEGTALKTGDIDFGPNALIDIQAEQARWLSAHLKGEDDGILSEPRVKVFVMGANRWRESDEWPISGTRYMPWYFASDGNANSMLGDGTLVPGQTGGVATDGFIYDPMHPVPTIGGSVCCLEEGMPVKMGPQDQRPTEYRQDVLCYTSEPMTEPLEVTGSVKAVVYASSSAVDTDFTAKLVDVRPDGYAMNVAQGILRARYRNGFRESELMEPGEVYRFQIDMWSTSICFLPGHRMRVEISSSNFPQHDRNLNTGEDNGLGTDMVTAHQTVYHDADHPSHIVLPVVPAG